MKIVSRQLFLVGLILIVLSSCNSTMFIAGTGASKSTVTSKKQWFVLWGLARCNKVNPKTLAGDAVNYTVKTEFRLSDMLINVFTSAISFQRETVTVIK